MTDTRSNTPVTIDGPCFARLIDGRYESATEITIDDGGTLTADEYQSGVHDIVAAGFKIPGGLSKRIRRTYGGWDQADALRRVLIQELSSNTSWRYYDHEGNAITALAPHLWEAMWA